jgi:hypothetical protein
MNNSVVHDVIVKLLSAAEVIDHVGISLEPAAVTNPQVSAASDYTFRIYVTDATSAMGAIGALTTPINMSEFCKLSRPIHRVAADDILTMFTKLVTDNNADDRPLHNAIVRVLERLHNYEHIGVTITPGDDVMSHHSVRLCFAHGTTLAAISHDLPIKSLCEADTEVMDEAIDDLIIRIDELLTDIGK